MPVLGQALLPSEEPSSSPYLLVTAIVSGDLSESSIGAIADYSRTGRPVFVKMSRDKAALKREYETLRKVRHCL
jgi:hypothetical protein